MSVDVSALKAKSGYLEDTSKVVWIVYPVILAFCFFIVSFFLMSNDSSYFDRIAFTVVGLVFGRGFGTVAKQNLEERRLVILSLLELHDAVSKLSPVEKTIPETIPAKVSEAVEKVEIPAEPNLPEIPSVAAPPEVKAALKAGKAKGKPTKLPSKRKAKTVPPAQA
jgi:hypothetical protein